MNLILMKKLIIIQLFFLIPYLGYCQNNTELKNKTLIVWISIDNAIQKGGSALTIDDRKGNFDGIVFGEVEAKKWMAGSNNFNRTQKDQTKNQVETANPDEFIQIAIVYEGKTITIYRNGQLYSSYVIDNEQLFSSSPTVLFGRRHLDIESDKNTFAGKIKDARIYSSALPLSTIQSMKPGVELQVPGLWAWWDFGTGSLLDKTQRFDKAQIVGNVSVHDGCLVLTGEGASLIAYNSKTEDKLVNSQAVPKDYIVSSRLLRERLLSDPYRPAFHFCFPEDDGRPGDPNGAFFHNGRYHLMYLYSKTGTGFTWGHASSTDLLHWRYHPDAIGPGDGDDGCFSGGAFVDDDGSAILSYWMLWNDKGIGLARSKDYYFDKWDKFANNPVIKSTEWGITDMEDTFGNAIHVGSADPSNIWKKEGYYYMLTGNLLVLEKYGRKENSPKEEKGDRLYLFKSADLKTWNYVHRFYESKREWTDASEDNMCPSFLPLPSSADGGKMSGKHLLLFISHNKGCQYYIGDYKNDKFFPENHGRMTWKDNAYFAPESLIDDKGRHIMWSWVFDDRPDSIINHYGWTGTYGLPRTLWVGSDGTLRMAPVKEVENLRVRDIPQIKSNIKIMQDGEEKVNELGKELMEIEVTFNPTKASRYGIKVGVSEDGKEETVIYYDASDKKLKFDSRKSGLTNYGRKIIEEAPLELKNNEPLVLRVFIDRSIIEVFANDRQSIARMVYPTLGGRGITLFSNGDVSDVKTIKTWELSPSNPY